MGWGDCGEDSGGRDIGYVFMATCDHEGCEAEIDRGLSYVCGDMHGEDEYSCEKYFCGDHRKHPDLDDEHHFWHHSAPALCFGCCENLELDEKETKEYEARQVALISNPIIDEIIDLSITVDDETYVHKIETSLPEFSEREGYVSLEDANKYLQHYSVAGKVGDEIPEPKYHDHQLDAFNFAAEAMQGNAFFNVNQGMGATNTSLGEFKRSQPAMARTLKQIMEEPPSAILRNARTGRWSWPRKELPEGVIHDENSAKTTVVRGELTVTFTDKSLYEAAKDGQEKLNRQLAEMVSEALVEKQRQMMKETLGRTQYTDEIQKLQNKKKGIGLNAVETGTLAHLKIMERTENLKAAYGGTRTLDVQEAMRQGSKLYPSRHLRPCPPKYHFEHHFTAPDSFIKGQAASRLRRKGGGEATVFHIDYADMEKRVMAHIADKNDERTQAWLNGDWSDVKVMDEGHMARDPEGNWKPHPGPQAKAMADKPTMLHIDIEKCIPRVREAHEARQHLVDTEAAHLNPGYHGAEIKDVWIDDVKIFDEALSATDLAAMSFHEVAEVPKDAWDKLGGAPKKEAGLDTWDLAMKKPK